MVRVALLLAVFLLARLRLPAQVLYGSILGAVVDQAKSAVPGANVTVVSSGTSQTREAVSDASGNFSFPSLPGGIYEV
ncbi:MAG: carboxypeptidase regulatory-like domain-containing protein, partial [Acidobacteriaceae bacterium]|nr:carboxypeptidase regulatory-like domain-containing protein [Acidobacteriaceae bacterium]